MRFAVNETAALIDSRPHYRFDAFSAVHTKAFENDISLIVFILMICTRLRFDPLPRAFLNGCIFDETAQRVSLADGRPEGIETKCKRFHCKRKRISVDGP